MSMIMIDDDGVGGDGGASYLLRNNGDLVNSKDLFLLHRGSFCAPPPTTLRTVTPYFYL